MKKFLEKFREEPKSIGKNWGNQTLRKLIPLPWEIWKNSFQKVKLFLPMVGQFLSKSSPQSK